MKLGRGVVIGSALVALVALMSFPRLLFGSDQTRAKELLERTCAGCHRLEGTPSSRLEKHAPDLIGVGSKFKHEWLVAWLAGKEPLLYAKGYRWDQSQAGQLHLAVSQSDADAIATYLETNFMDPTVKRGAIDMTTFSKQEAAFGEKIFKEHACIGCHQIREGDKIIGGPQSASLATAGKRLKADWVYRFNSNPPDYVPHSGEFVGDVSELGLRYVTGYIVTRGWDDFPYYEPWKSEPFGHTSLDRGRMIYKEYCAQCHGAEGKGDGPAASGLAPKPAIHANIPFEKVPTEYLYNVIYYGGIAVGKSPTMPYWGLTIGQQGVADVMAYLKATFKSEPGPAAAPNGQQSRACAQPRKTAKAPDEFLSKANPLPASADMIEAGKLLFVKTAQPMACAMCHGEQADGKGFMGAALIPPPRDFTCGSMMKDVPDGQLFWIIRHGSPGTGMLSFAGLSDEQVWQLIRYIRSVAK